MDLQTRKAKAESIRLGSREVRRFAAPCEMRADSDGLLTMDGYASVTDREYDMGWYGETIRSGSFDKTLSEYPDVQLLVNHEGLPIARTKGPGFGPDGPAGLLTLSADSQGLKPSARLDPTDYDVARLAPKVQARLIDQMSFGFRVARQEWDEDHEHRVITEVNLHRGDVSIVNQGANPHTSVTVRSLLTRDIDPDELEAMRPDLERLLHPTRRSAVELVDMLTELRAGKAFSDANMAVLKDCLSRVADADDAVDAVLINLSALIGVPNPDTDKQRAAPDLDYFRALAHASRLRGRSTAA